MLTPIPTPQPPPPISISQPKKVQQLQFQILGILLFTGVQKLYGPEITPFLPRMLQFLENLRRRFIFSNHILETEFRLDLLESSNTLALELLTSFSLCIIRKKTTENESLEVRLQKESWTC